MWQNKMLDYLVTSPIRIPCQSITRLHFPSAWIIKKKIFRSKVNFKNVTVNTSGRRVSLSITLDISQGNVVAWTLCISTSMPKSKKK